ncbi:MAG: hypothetical protein [Olavius algarvensis Delta 4 endosymbiont]|nr:MAG: hypothetical protein [Olavius algarvensis Delta 4 endosymbiont]
MFKVQATPDRQGGREVPTGGASEANALRGKYASISRIGTEYPT